MFLGVPCTFSGSAADKIHTLITISGEALIIATTTRSLVNPERVKAITLHSRSSIYLLVICGKLVGFSLPIMSMKDALLGCKEQVIS